jgi:hypothetical protein
VGTQTLIFNLAGRSSTGMYDPYADLMMNCHAQLGLLGPAASIPGAKIILRRGVWVRILPVDAHPLVNRHQRNSQGCRRGLSSALRTALWPPLTSLRLTNTYRPGQLMRWPARVRAVVDPPRDRRAAAPNLR